VCPPDRKGDGGIGPSVEVLSPPELRTEMAKVAADVAKLYRTRR